MRSLHLLVRRVARERWVVLTAVVALGTALGAAVSGWTVVAAFVRPLQVDQANEVVGVFEDQPDGPSQLFTHAQYVGIERSGALARVGAIGYEDVAVEEGSLWAARTAAFISQSIFDVFALAPEVGRPLLPMDDLEGAAPVALVSFEYWRSTFASDFTVLGREVRIGRGGATIVGVMPRNFRGVTLAKVPAIYLPLRTVEQFGQQGRNYLSRPTGAQRSAPSAWLSIWSRLQRGQTAGSADKILSDALRSASGSSLALVPAQQAIVPASAWLGLRRAVTLFAIVVGLILLIGINVACTLVTIQNVGRSVEFAVRSALGARPASLILDVALGVALIVLGGGLVGVAAAKCFLVAFVGIQELPAGMVMAALNLDMRSGLVAGVVTVFIAALSLAVASIRPVLAAREQLPEAVVRHSVGMSFHSKTWHFLLATNALVAVFLLAGAILVGHEVIRLASVERGFTAEGLAMASVNVGAGQYSREAAAALFDQMTERLAHRPGIEGVSFSVGAGGVGPPGALYLDGRPHEVSMNVAYVAVGGDYFKLLKAHVVQGRTFATADVAGSENVAVISQSLARYLTPNGDVLGHTIGYSAGRRAMIVGVVGDVLWNLRFNRAFMLYVPFSQSASWLPAQRRRILMRSERPGDALTALYDLSWRAGKGVAIESSVTATEAAKTDMAVPRLLTQVMTILSVVALVLTVMAVNAAVAAMMSRRRVEFGIRVVLGANARNLMALMMRDTMRPIAEGALGGLAGLWLVLQVVGAEVFGFPKTDVAVAAGSALLVIGVASAVTVARMARTMREEPARILRHL